MRQDPADAESDTRPPSNLLWDPKPADRGWDRPIRNDLRARHAPRAVLTRPVYPPSRIAPPIAGHRGLAHGGLTEPIERGDEVSEWKETQRAKERADIVVKDGELSAAEKSEMGSVFVSGHGYVACGRMHVASRAQSYRAFSRAETDCGLGATCMRSLGANWRSV